MQKNKAENKKDYTRGLQNKKYFQAGQNDIPQLRRVSQNIFHDEQIAENAEHRFADDKSRPERTEIFFIIHLHNPPRERDDNKYPQWKIKNEVADNRKNMSAYYSVINNKMICKKCRRRQQPG